MARRRRNRRYRKGRFRPLLRILFFLLVCGALAAAITIFFKVEHVEVEGASRYSVGEVVAAAGVEPGDNLFLLNKYAIRDQLVRELPYIGDVRIRRRLPSTLVVEVTETEAAAAVADSGGWWLIGREGKLLEWREDSANLLQITGVGLLMPTAGSYLALGTEEHITVPRLLELLTVLEDRGMTRSVRTVDCSDASVLVLRYLDRFRVELRYDANYEKKMRALTEVVARLEENETGVIRMTYDSGETHFIPGEFTP